MPVLLWEHGQGDNMPLTGACEVLSAGPGAQQQLLATAAVTIPHMLPRLADTRALASPASPSQNALSYSGCMKSWAWCGHTVRAQQVFATIITLLSPALPASSPRQPSLVSPRSSHPTTAMPTLAPALLPCLVISTSPHQPESSVGRVRLFPHAGGCS